MELRVQLHGDVLKKLAVAGPKAKSAIIDGVADASKLLWNRAITTAPASTGNLRKSIRRDFLAGGLKATIYPTVDYALRLHGDGKAARSAPFTIPVQEAQKGGTLYRWAKKKGLNAMTIRAVIAKRGIRHQPWLRDAAKDNEKNVVKIMTGALRTITRALAD